MKEILSGEQVKRTLRRMTHEIIERNNNLENIILVGVKSKGVPIGLEIKNNIKDFTNIEIPFYELDISSYRDDKDLKGLENKFNVAIDSRNGRSVLESLGLGKMSYPITNWLFVPICKL